MRISTIVIACMAVALIAGLCHAEPQDAAASLQKAISEARDQREEALLRKRLGDWYAAREQNALAATEFVRAIKLAPTAFTDQEQVRMATVISWAEQHGEAEAILRSVLERSPKNREARLQLARVLSWEGKLSDAGSQADVLLAANPDDQDALIARANILRWSGKAQDAIPLYQKALGISDNFDARLGLAYAYLATGDVRSARNTAGAAKPAYPYQQKELSTFEAAAKEQHQWWAGMDYSYYHDSDENRTKRTGIWVGTRVGKWDTELAYRVADATDPLRSDKAEELRLIGRGRIGTAGIRASAGYVATDANSAKMGIGQVNGDMDLGRASLWAGVAHDMFTDTAELIQNRIMRTAASISLSERLASSFILQEAFTRTSYSDDNSSNDLKMTVKYPLARTNPRATVGYQFRYWDFDKETHHGYFDPHQFMSHQLFASLSWEQDHWYASFDPYVGYQSFARSGKNTHEPYGGFSGAVGWRPKKMTSVEANAEGGNYAAGAAAGYNYYMVGIRVIVGL